MPLLADVYGLYYNKDLLAKAGISGPPKTISELYDDAKKLTQRNSDGSIKVAGFVPTIGLLRERRGPLRPQLGRAMADPGRQGGDRPPIPPGPTCSNGRRA